MRPYDTNVDAYWFTTLDTGTLPVNTWAPMTLSFNTGDYSGAATLWLLNDGSTAGGRPTEVVFDIAPEPAGVLLMGTCGAILALVIRRRRSRPTNN